MSTASDELLTQRATQGDRQAFEAIYERYHRDLYRFCLAMLGNPQDAQDALQNTMVKVLRALPGEERRIQLKPWLYRIARNEAVETMRRRRDSVEIEPAHAVSTGEIADTVEAREKLRRLFADLEELPERQRSALVMRELADLGFEQIAEAFETSAAVARQTVYEARLSLRQMEAGREMSCDQVMRELSDADGRVTRRRELQAHLRGCASCRAFAGSIESRRSELAAIAPLPVGLSAAMLHGILSGKASAATLAGSAAGTGSGAGGGIAGTIGAGAGKAVATSAILKSAAAVAVVAVGVGAAGRSGLIHVPLISGNHKTSRQGPPQPGAGGSAAGGAGAQGEKKSTGGAAGHGEGAKGAAAGHRAGAAAGKGNGARAAGAQRHTNPGGHGARSRGAGHAAAPAQARSHSRSHAHAGGRAAPPASSRGKHATEAHKPTVHHPPSSPAGGGASHRHRSPPKHAVVKPRPPRATPPVTPPASREASGSAAASNARR